MLHPCPLLNGARDESKEKVEVNLHNNPSVCSILSFAAKAGLIHNEQASLVTMFKSHFFNDTKTRKDINCYSATMLVAVFGKG